MWMLALALLFATETAAPSPMTAVDFLAGEWDGTGWILMGPQGKATFNQHESIHKAAGGSVVVIEGLGTSTDEATKGRVVHQAFAVVSYDAESKQYRWRAWVAGGGEVAVTPEISGKKLVWGFKDPRSGRDIRFTITVTDAGEWHEIGEMVMGEGKAFQFFEMNLKRRA
jgi:hypothetical protein